MGIQVAERAEYIRVIMAELSRIQNHLIFIGMLLNDLGAMYTPALYAFEERELILDIFEAVCRLAHDVQLLPLWRRGARPAGGRSARRSRVWSSTACPARWMKWTAC